jgi:hypothetical protein
MIVDQDLRDIRLSAWLAVSFTARSQTPRIAPKQGS